MKYELFSNGHLVEGKDEAESLARISQITKLPEEKVRQALLSGQSVKLTNSSDKEKLTKLYHALRDAGLDVVMTSQDAVAVESRPDAGKMVSDPTAERTAAKIPANSGWKRWMIVSLFLLVLITAGVGGYAWYWFQQPLPPEVETAENALFDGNLVAIGVIDTNKLLALDKYWFGSWDPNALPLDAQNRGLLEELFTGPTQFREHLTHALLALSLSPDERKSKKVMLLSGTFEPGPVTGVLRKHYDVQKIDGNQWSLVKKEPPKDKLVCKKEVTAEPETYYLRISPTWVMLTNDQAHGETIWQRMQSRAAASQDTAQWHNYRAGKLLSFMALTPSDAGKAWGGLPGMMASGAASQNSQVTGVAAGVDVALLQGGMNANLHLMSEDANWNSEMASSMRQKLDTAVEDDRSVSPTVADIISRLTITDRANALDIDLQLDSQIFNELGEVAKEGLGSLFSVSLSNNSSEKTEERINEKPQQYVNLNLTELPPFKDKYQSEPPLYSNGPFAVDFKSIKSNSEGVMEIWLEGKVGLPDNQDRRYNKIGKLSMTVTSVQDEAGNELLRDERCMGPNDLKGKSPNEKEESNTQHQQDNGWVWKHVRVRPEVTVEQIQRIKGTISFTVPTRVKRFEVPLKAGEVVEHAGMRFFLSSLKGDSITYQVSGNSDRLIEVRVLNKDGKVLQQGWSMQDSDSGRTSQSFAGEIRALQIFVVEQYFSRKADFLLEDLFHRTTKPENTNRPTWFAPKKIDRKLWQKYARLDLKKLIIDPKKEWMMWDKSTPVAEKTWGAVRVFVTHTPRQWGNSPTAYLYFPQLESLPGVLSGLSYRIDEPAVKDGSKVNYHNISYSYYTNSGEVVIEQELKGQPVALNSINLNTGLEDNQKLSRLKGEFVFRLPQKTQSTRLRLRELWEGKTVDGVTVSLQEVTRGMFPGYGLKIEGEIDKLVNLHGISSQGERVMAKPVNLQRGGYWTMTLPFGEGIEEVELVTATAQEVIRYPFDFKPAYSEK